VRVDDRKMGGENPRDSNHLTDEMRVPMSDENELARAKWFLLGLLVFLVSGCISYGEVAYFLNGRDADADVTKVYESRGRRGSTSLTVEYAFVEPDGTRRKGMESVLTDWPVPANGKVGVRYTAGEDGSSRFSGRVRWLGLGLFAVSAGVVVLCAVRLLIEGASEPAPRRKRK
jgi:hypothetical protein